MDKVKRKPKKELSRLQGAIAFAVFLVVATVGLALAMVAASYSG